MEEFLTKLSNNTILSLFKDIHINNLDQIIVVLILERKYPELLVNTIDKYLEKIEKHLLNIPLVYYPKNMIIRYNICMLIRYNISKKPYIPKILFIQEYNEDTIRYILSSYKYIHPELIKHNLTYIPNFRIDFCKLYLYTTDRISILFPDNHFNNKSFLKNIVKLNNSTDINYLEFIKNYTKVISIPTYKMDIKYYNNITFTNVEYYIIDVPGDGNCFYNSVLTGMYINGYKIPIKYGVISSNIVNYTDKDNRLSIINKIKKDASDILLKDYLMFKTSNISVYIEIYTDIANRHRININSIDKHLLQLLDNWLSNDWSHEIYCTLNRIIIKYILKIKLYVLSDKTITRYDCMDIDYITINKKPITIINYGNIHFKYLHII